MSKTPITETWRKGWAGDSQYADPIVHDAVEVMSYMETEWRKLRECVKEYIENIEDYSSKSERLRAMLEEPDTEIANKP